MARERRTSMARRFVAWSLALPALWVAGCQDYNFNPVGHCLISPASKRVTLSSISTADVLFVVDDSGSMRGEQIKLGQNFKSFIDNLDATNVARQGSGLDPIDFHVAVTTTSIFYSAATTAYCRDDCGSAKGSLVCCKTSGGASTTPLTTVHTCSGDSDGSCAAAAAGACRQDCQEHLGEWVCCDPTSKIPAATQTIACSTADEPCGELDQAYVVDSTCGAGNAVSGEFYPHGAFIGYANNPRVLHFDKSLYTCTSGTCTNAQGITSAQLRDDFAVLKGGTSDVYQGNVIAGTCGSGQEQALQAARLAVEKAVAGEQLDTCDASGTCGSAASYPAGWLHQNSKLVLVFVGDEDDCSSPESATGSVIMASITPGSDSCVADQALAAGAQKEFPVPAVVDYFTGLGRPLGAAFIVSTAQTSCQDDACTPGLCIDTTCTEAPAVCGGQARGTRLLEAYAEFKAAGADVVAGSICDGDFASVLDRIAEIVKPPSGLLLPSEPANTDVTLLRIASASGKTRKTCRGPAPAGLTADQAAADAYDWWFTASREQDTAGQRASTAATRYVYINHATGNCEANGGETFSADYLARLPSSGCQTDDDCVGALGGKSGDWTCFSGVDSAGACSAPTPTAPGTCLCGARAANCPNG
jgi:hypothetical protein